MSIFNKNVNTETRRESSLIRENKKLLKAIETLTRENDSLKKLLEEVQEQREDALSDLDKEKEYNQTISENVRGMIEEIQEKQRLVDAEYKKVSSLQKEYRDLTLELKGIKKKYESDVRKAADDAKKKIKRAAKEF